MAGSTDIAMESFETFKNSVALELAVKKKQYAKRSLAKMVWRLGNGLQIAVNMYLHGDVDT